MSRVGICLAVVAVTGAMLFGLTATSAKAQTRLPAKSSPADLTTPNLEKQAIRRSSNAAGTPTTNAATASKQSSGLDYGRLMLAMGIVLALIVLLRFVGLRLFPASAQARTTGVIRVLSRSAIAPKQQFLLVQVGNRLIVVADSNSRMTPLAEITDPQEVATIIGQISAESPASISGAFSSLFGKAKKKFETDVEELGKRPLKQTVGKVLYDDEALTADDEDHEDETVAIKPRDASSGPELTAATLELKDLGERVRALAGQIRGR